MGPDVRICRLVKDSYLFTTSKRFFSPINILVNPWWLDNLKFLWTFGFLKSQSTKSTLRLAWAITYARLLDTRLFPSSGTDEVTTMVLISLSMAENLILVLRVLKASEIGDLGFVIDISCDSYLSIIGMVPI